MKKRLFIIGAGGLGRQIEYYLDMLANSKNEWELKGYIDDNVTALDGKGSDYKVLGAVNQFQFEQNDYVVIAVGNIESKKKLVNFLDGKVEFFTLICKDVLIGKQVQIGRGTIICPGAKIGSNVQIGEFGLINLDTIVGHDSKIGNNCSIMTQVALGGGSKIGDDVFIGTKGAVAPLTSVTDKSVLGVGAIVIKNIEKAGTYFGNPARRML